MNDQPSNKRNSEELELEKLLSELAGDDPLFEDDRDHFRNSEPDDISISPDETEHALRTVHTRLGFEPGSDASKSTAKIHTLRYVAAAAILLIVFAAGYLLIPVHQHAPAGEMLSVNLPDGTAAELNSETQITYNRMFGRSNRNLSLNGEAYFRVQANDTPFIVTANGSVTEVTGTEFNIRSWSSDPGSPTTVSVTKGEVRFYNKENEDERVTLSKGLTSRWLPGTLAPDEPDSTDERIALAWRKSSLAFAGQQLVVIFNELERKFDTRIDIENDQIASEILTTFYSQPNNLELLLDDITTVKGLSYRKTANGYYVFRE